MSGGVGSRLFAGWMEIAARFGEVQTLILVCLMYAFAIGPVAVGARLFGRDLLGKRGLWADSSAWQPADTVVRPDLERAHRQF
ncbi:MAG: hypothetical protein QNK05_07535 [Myxococcota bacterium]|nr:hypothetical protein [Myxococcota bacterium]